MRLLLLERERRGPWWRNFLHVESATTKNRISQSQYKLPHELAPLEYEFLWELIENILDESGAETDMDERTVLEDLNSIDPLGRPLFAALAAEALSEGASIRQWNQQQLVKNVLSREEQRWRRELEESLGSQILVERYLNLLAFVTVVGGLSLIDAEVLLSDTGLDGLLPTAMDFHTQVYERLFRAAGSSQGLPPIEPDIMGEAFVLERLRPKGASNSLVRTLGECWRNNAASTAGFVSRAVLDFPNHESALLLLQPPEGAHEELFWWSVSLVVSAPTIAGNSPQDFELLTNRLRKGSENSPEERRLSQNLAMAYFDAAVEFLNCRRFGNARKILLLAGEVPCLPRELVIEIKYNLGLANYGLGKQAEAIGIFTNVWGSPGGPRRTRAWALHNRAAISLQNGRREDAIVDLSELTRRSWVPSILKLEALDYLRLIEAVGSEASFAMRGPSSQFGGVDAIYKFVEMSKNIERWYEELKSIAARLVKRVSDMDAEDLVHEVYLRLWRYGRDQVLTEERFFTVASRGMRNVLVDHSRARVRRGTAIRVDLSVEDLPEEELFAGKETQVEILDIDNALHQLALVDERGARIVELRYFGGFKTGEIASLIGASKSSVNRNLFMARRFLQRVLSGDV